MDPVSLCASILAVISAAQSVAKGVRKLKGYWQAPQLIRDIIAEIESLQSTLQDVSAFVASAHSLPDIQGLCEPVSRTAFAIQKISALISSPPPYTIRLGDANHARVTWLCHKNEIKGLLEDLRIVRMDLMIRLGLLAASAITRIEELMSISMGIQSSISQQLSTFQNRNGKANGGPPRAVQQEVQEDAAGVRNLLLSNQSREPIETTPGTSPSSENVLSRPLRTQTTQTCPAWCSCKCHVRRQFRSPWILETICGRIDVQYSGQLPECNEKKCRRSMNAPFSMTYHFPFNLIKRYVTLKTCHTPLDGPTFALRAPRVIEGTSLLWHYVIRGDIVAIQRMFSKHQASPYDVDANGCNVSIFAVNNKDYRVSQFLIEQGADPTLPNQRGRTASELLWDRAFGGQYGQEGQSIVRSILKDSDYIEGRNFSVLHKIVLSLVSKDLQSELEISTSLLNCGDATNRTPLTWAVVRDHVETVETLLAYGADPNIADILGYSPLHFVRSSGTCKALLSAGANISSRSTAHQKSPLHEACYIRRKVEVVDALVEAGIPVDVRDTDNETPLMRAIYETSTAKAEKLIELGADVNAVKNSRMSPILIAVHRNLQDLIPLLLARGADYTAVAVDGTNIAHLAAELAYPETFRILAESNLQGLDVWLKDKGGKTPADRLAERDFFGENETIVQEAFEAFVRSVASSNPEPSALGVL